MHPALPQNINSQSFLRSSLPISRFRITELPAFTKAYNIFQLLRYIVTLFITIKKVTQLSARILT